MPPTAQQALFQIPPLLARQFQALQVFNRLIGFCLFELAIREEDHLAPRLACGFQKLSIVGNGLRIPLDQVHRIKGAGCAAKHSEL